MYSLYPDRPHSLAILRKNDTISLLTWYPPCAIMMLPLIGCPPHQSGVFFIFLPDSSLPSGDGSEVLALFVRAIGVVGLLSLGHLASGKNDHSCRGAACPEPVSWLVRVFGQVETPDYAFHKFIARLCSNQSFLIFGDTTLSSPTSADTSTQAVAARLTSTASMGGVQRRPVRGLSGLFHGVVLRFRNLKCPNSFKVA